MKLLVMMMTMMAEEELTGRDTLDTTTTGETSDSRLGNALDVVTKNLAVTLGTALAEALAALSTYRPRWLASFHSILLCVCVCV
jgi:hypothetical protein